MRRKGLIWRDWAEQGRRFAARHEPFLLLCAIIVVLFGLGGLSLRWALVCALGLLTWAMAWPLRDVTSDKTKAQEATSAQKLADGSGATALWRSMLDAIADPALMLDPNSRLLATNTSATALFPISDGRELAQVNRTPELLAAVDRAFRTVEAQPFDLHATVPVERHLYGLATPLSRVRARPGDPAMLIILRDRTAEQQLAEMRADFVANASHELRTPLASLKGFIETLQGPAKDDPAARERFLPIMHDQASRMTRLIEDLLSLSRIEMHEHVPPSATVDLAEIVDGVAKSMQQIAANGGQHLTVSLIGQPAPVVGDRDELAQVLQNLVHNAIKYGRRDGTVAVTVRHQGPQVAVVVADNGIGIAPEHLPRLTERFYRVSAKVSRERGGTGLGLAIVKHIVNRHGGEMRIESTPDKGSTFTILLPVARAIQRSLDNSTF
jgi:two-component system, OmpR family, phosphate regulon sensor histidine kinase PhoR